MNKFCLSLEIEYLASRVYFWRHQMNKHRLTGTSNQLIAPSFEKATSSEYETNTARFFIYGMIYNMGCLTIWDFMYIHMWDVYYMNGNKL